MSIRTNYKTINMQSLKTPVIASCDYNNLYLPSTPKKTKQQKYIYCTPKKLFDTIDINPPDVKKTYIKNNVYCTPKKLF